MSKAVRFEDTKLTKFNGISTTWKDVLYGLVRNGKIEKAAIVHPEGHLSVCSENLKVTDRDITGIKMALSGKYRSLMKICMWGNYYTCFHPCDDTDTIVGKAEEEVFVAQKSCGYLIIAIAHPETPGSTIYEVTKFGRGLNRGMQREKIG